MNYITLFVVAFLSGSLLPLGSEALLSYNILNGYSPYLVVIVATIGNVLGSVLNYYMGLKGEEYLLKKGYIKSSSINSAKIKFKKFGAYSLLLSSLPIIGDPLTFIAGILNYNFKLFLLFVTLSKLIRYIIVVYITLGYL